MILYKVVKIDEVTQFYDITNRKSPKMIRKLNHCCKVERLPLLKPILDVKTRWNSTYEMIERALTLQRALESICNSVSHLRPMALSSAEWIYLQKLQHLLNNFVKFTVEVSASKHRVTINQAVPTYNVLIDAIDQYAADSDNGMQLRTAAFKARSKLVKYYGKTDDCPIYAIATALDPELKYRYWNDTHWGSYYTNMAIGTVEACWEESYKPNNQEPDPVISPALERKRHRIGLSRRQDDNNGGASSRRLNDELATYISEVCLEPTEDDNDAELAYWRNNEYRFKNLARMARDYLAIPLTSTPSERAFSGARLMIPYTRNRMKPETLERLVLLKSWLKKNKKA